MMLPMNGLIKRHFRFSSDIGNIIVSLAVSEDQTVQMIVRNKAGKFVWYFRNKFSDYQPNAEHNADEYYEIDVKQEQTKEEEKVEFVDLFNDQNVNCPIKPDDKFVNKTREREGDEKLSLKVHKNRPISIDEADLPKLLLAHLGKIHHPTKFLGLIYFIGEEIIENGELEEIDKLPIHKQMSCACLFARSGSQDADAILECPQVSFDYESFLNQLVPINNLMIA